MMNYIWAGILLVSVVYAMFSGNLDALGTALTESSNEAVEFVIGLAGIMAMWSGLMEIAERTGLINSLSRLLLPFTRLLFPGRRDPETLSSIIMSFMANIFGAAKTVVFDINDERLDLGKRLGATDGINTLEEGFMDKAKALTGGRGFDYVFETAGNTITMKMAFELAANKADVCFVGTPTRDLSFTVDEWENMNRKEFTLTGSWMSYSAPFPGKEWDLTAHYFKTGQLQFDDSFIFKKVPLSEIDQAFEMYKTPGAVKGKILIDSER